MNPYFTADDLSKPSMGINWSYISQIDTSNLMLKSNRSTMKIILQDFLNTTNFDGVPGHLAAHLFIILQIIIRTMIKNHKKRDQKLSNQIENNEFLKMQVRELKSKIHRNKSLSKNEKLNQTLEESQSKNLQIVQTPQYHDIAEDVTRKVLAITNEDRKLQETIHDVEKELLYQQKSNELKIKHYFQKKMLKLNNKIDQMSAQINNDFSDTFSYISDGITISENNSKTKVVNNFQTKEIPNQNTVSNNIPQTNINNDVNVDDHNATKDIFYISSTASD